jgi:hypothetical protein
MIDQEIYSKLTPSARDALNELSNEYVQDVLEKAIELAAEKDRTLREISLIDIMAASMSKGVPMGKRNVAYARRRRFSTLLIFSGVVYAFAGLLIYLYQTGRFDAKDSLGLSVSIIGALVAVVGYLMRDFIYGYPFSRTMSLSSSDFELVEKWQEIESLAKKIITASEKVDPNSTSVASTIKFLTTKIATDPGESAKIRELLAIRNRIVHEQLRLSDKTRFEMSEFADKLIDRLEKSLKLIVTEEPRLRIVNALYGTLKKSLDATRELASLVQNNRLEVVANNEIVGDPDIGAPKQLEITYEFGGSKFKRMYNEGDKVIIPS